MPSIAEEVGKRTGPGRPPGMIRTEDEALTEAWAHYWFSWIASAFVKSYWQVGKQGNYLPASPEEFRALLRVFLLEKAVYELGYELNNRPDWVRIPLMGILELMQREG